jgi:hypothetical protein
MPIDASSASESGMSDHASSFHFFFRRFLRMIYPGQELRREVRGFLAKKVAGESCNSG